MATTMTRNFDQRRCPTAASTSSSLSCFSDLSSTTNNSRVEFLKHRFSDLINKSQQTLAGVQQPIPTNTNYKNVLNVSNNVAAAGSANVGCRKKPTSTQIGKSAGNPLKRKEFEKTLVCEKQSIKDVHVNNNVAAARANVGCRKRPASTQILKSAGNPSKRKEFEKPLISEKQSNVKDVHANNNVSAAARPAVGCRKRPPSTQIAKSAGNPLKRNDFQKTLICQKQSRSEDFAKTLICEKQSIVDKDANVTKKRKKSDDDDDEAEQLEIKTKLRKLEIQKMREASRNEINQMTNDTGICDPQEVMRDFAELIGCDPTTGRMVWPDTGSFLDVHRSGEASANLVKGWRLFDQWRKDELELEEGEIRD